MAAPKRRPPTKGNLRVIKSKDKKVQEHEETEASSPEPATVNTSKSHTIEVVQVPISEIVLDREVIEPGKISIQRAIREPHWKKIARNFDPAALGMLTGFKNGVDQIVLNDGQHRLLALREIDYEDLVTVEVHYDISRSDAAHGFLQKNDYLYVNPVDKFQKAVMASEDHEGYDDQAAIAEILAERKLQVGPKDAKLNGNRPLTCASKLLTVYRAHKEEGTEAIIDTLLTAFPEDPVQRSLTAETIGAVSEMVLVYKEEARRPDLERLAHKLNEYGLTALEKERDRNYRTERSLPKSFYMTAAFIGAYNDGLSKAQKLTPWHVMKQQ